MKVGLEENIKRRYGWKSILYSALGGFCVVFGARYALEGKPYDILPYVLIICGVIILLKRTLYVRKALKTMFMGKPESSRVYYKFDELSVLTETPGSKGEVKWDQFYEVAVGEKGIHLFVQKGLFYWVPRDSTMLQGSWEDLVTLISKKQK